MYSDKTNSELIEILDQHSLLTFEAQLSLRDELEERAVVVDLSGLESTIANKLEQIHTVTRTKKAMMTDILAVVVGLFVFLLGVYGCVNLVLTFLNGDELDVFTLAYKFAMAALVFIGFSFFSGLKRLFDFSM
mgnify:CR=1 FL=1